MGPPGSFRQENARYPAEQFGWKGISGGDLIKKEIAKKTELGREILATMKAFEFSK